MLRDNEDKNRLYYLLNSMNTWAKKTNNAFTHTEFDKETGSLYRFGWFVINGYKYSVSGWKFKEGVVTFEHEDTHEKIKYDIMTCDVMNKKFKKDTFLQHHIKKIRVTFSDLLRTLSDKLQP